MKSPILLSIAAAMMAGFLFTICQNQYKWTHVEFVNYIPDVSEGSEVSQVKEVFLHTKDGTTSHTVHGWLVEPKTVNDKKFPVVIMSHGLGAQKDMGLLQYGHKFAYAGYATFIFDYRSFGGTIQTEPKGSQLRNYINPWNHVADIKTVVRAVHDGALGDRVDVNSVSLWGTSFAGGHMLKVAADLGPSMVKCVISQVPHLDGKAASKRGIVDRGVVGTIRVAVLAIADYVSSSLLGLAPVYVKIAGTKQDVAYMMLSDEHLKIYFSKHPKQYMGGWQNLAPARTLAVMSLYNPISIVHELQVPVLYIGATDDTLCPIEYVRTAYFKTTNSTLLEINTSHFGIYSGEPFEKATVAMTEFLNKNAK